jgi:hypothetical protein
MARYFYPDNLMRVRQPRGTEQRQGVRHGAHAWSLFAPAPGPDPPAVVSRARGTPTRMPRDSEVPADCSNLATEDRGHPPFRVICFAQTKRLWCNSDNFPKGGWPGVRWEHRSASHGEPFAPEPYV